MKKERNKVNRSKWRTVNIVVCVMLFMLSCWFLTVFQFEIVLGLAMIVCSMVGAVLGKLSDKFESCRIPRNIFSAVAFIILPIMIALPVVLVGFKDIKVMYPVRKTLYSGTIDGYEYLPEKLPEKCDDYIFIAQGQAIAQDYHPSSYLAFFTDSETIAELEEKYNALGYNVHEVQPVGDDYFNDLRIDGATEEEIAELKARNVGAPSHVTGRLGNSYFANVAEPRCGMDGSRYPKGFFCDYTIGLVVIWT